MDVDLPISSLAHLVELLWLSFNICPITVAITYNKVGSARGHSLALFLEVVLHQIIRLIGSEFERIAAGHSRSQSRFRQFE